MTAYLINMGGLVCIYMLLALGLNLQWGHTGLINFGHVGFFAIGAYTSALLSLSGVPIALGVIAGTLLASVFALPVGWLTVTLKSDYLAVVTIGFSEILRLVLLNSQWSGGPRGLTGVPRLFSALGPAIAGQLWILVLAAAVLAVWVSMRQLTESPFGRVLRAIQADEIAAASLGKNVALYKTLSLVIGSGAAGLAGGLYAHWIGFVSPEQFIPLITFNTWTGIVLGGSSHIGAIMGAGILALILESTRFAGDVGIPLDGAQLAAVRYVVVGILLIAILRLRPQGIRPYRPKSTRHRESPADTSQAPHSAESSTPSTGISTKTVTESE